MIESLATAFKLAGFLLAQVTSVLSSMPGEDLTPVAFVSDHAGQRFEFFEGTTLEAMIENGKQKLASGKYDAWTLAYEGFLTLEGKRQNAFFIHSWVRGLDRPVVIAHAWARSSDGKTVVLTESPFLLHAENAPEAGRTKRMDPVALDDEQVQVLREGMARNEAVRSQGLIGQ